MKISRRKNRFPRWQLQPFILFCHPSMLAEIRRIPNADKRAMMTGEIGTVDCGFRFITSPEVKP